MRQGPLPDQRRAGDGRALRLHPVSPRQRRAGTQISFTADDIPGLIDITIGSLDQPARRAPTLHCWETGRLPWLHLADDLPQFPEFPPSA